MIAAVKRLVTGESRRFLKFCVVGASGIPVNLLFAWLGSQVLFGSLALLWRNALASLLGIVVSVFTNFVLDDVWTWGDRRKGRFVGRMARFYLVSSLACGIQWAVAVALSTLVLHLRLELAQLVGIALGTAANFLLNHLWTYRARSPSPGAGDPPGSGRSS